MKIKALRTIVGDYGRIIRDDEGDVDTEVGKKLIAKGYAVEAGDATAAEAKTEAKAEEHEAKTERPKRKDKPDAVNEGS